MDAKTAKAVPITEYLARAGCQPVRVQGTDWWYLSPLRNEKTPSFKVNSEKNVWYDHGEGRGGTAIDLAMAMGDLSPGEAIRELCGMA